jgi:excisionase family DNA binding protein
LEQGWLKVSEACTYAGVSRNTIKQMVKDGRFSGDTTPGGHWRIDRESIDRWFRRTEEKALRIAKGIRV